jgi:vesicle-fusing ATPase
VKIVKLVASFHMPAPVTMSNPSQTTNTFVDLSGISTDKFKNPYDALLATCENDPSQIQARYALHRNIRNSQQKEKMLSEDFPGVNIDQILLRLCRPEIEPGYTDPRHCLVFWARPPQKVRNLIASVQRMLFEVAPNLWLMPQDCLHMTALEVTHSRTAEEIEKLVNSLREFIPSITDYTLDYRARLVRPMISFDASALALSFLPAAGENPTSGRSLDDDRYSYHHLRRDLYNKLSETGVEVDSRYVVPSSHLTIGRFIEAKDFADETGASDPEKMRAFIDRIDEINEWLKNEYWPECNDGKIKVGGEWVVGEEKGLDCRMGPLWYGGGGETVHVGKGF